MFSDMHLVFLILTITTICFMIPRFRSDLVAICSLLALLLTGMLTVPEAFAGFSNQTVIMIAALFIVGEGIFQTGLAQKAGNLLVSWTGKSEWRLMVLMMLLVATLGGFISNTGTVAILMPIVVSLCRQVELHPSKMLMPLAFASSMGGVLTLIGTPPNMLASQSLQEHGYGALSFFSFTPIGILIFVAGAAFMWFYARKRLDKPVEKSTEMETFQGRALLEQYEVVPFVHAVRVPPNNEAVGKSLKQLQWPSHYGLTVLEIVQKNGEGKLRFPPRPNKRRFTAKPGYILEENDVLFVYATPESFQHFIEETGMIEIEFDSKESKYQLDFSKMAEVIVTPQSSLLSHTLGEIHFRDKYGLTILAVKNPYKGSRPPQKGQRLSAGDTLLVHGKWRQIDLVSQEKSDFVVLQHDVRPSDIANSWQKWIALTILLLMVVLLLLEPFPAVVSVAMAAVLMILSGCVRQTDQAYRSINWQTVVLIACMLPMATALEKTGGIAFLSSGIVSSLGNFGPYAVLAGIYFVTAVFGVFISNTATAVLLYPVAILTAQQLGVNPVPMVMAVAYSASMSFATPVSTPPNAMVMAAGNYKFFDYVRIGVPLQLFIAVVVLLLIPLFFPF